MKSKPVVSIIMPVYKVENYISRAIESIQNQTMKDWELWAVDDGSPDKSGNICDVYAQNDSRIHVIHKENGGAPSARNIAMKTATGKYFYFMDSDDWVEPDMLQEMVDIAEKSKAQLVVAAFYIDTYYSDCEKYTELKKQPAEVFSSQQAFRENAYRLFDWNLLYTPWNKLYSANYLKENEIQFPITLWDDFPFNLSVIYKVEIVAVTDKAYYHFIRKRSESETAKYNPNMYEKREEEHQWMLNLYKEWGISDAASKEMICRRYVERLVGCIENLTNSKCELNSREKKERIRQMIVSPICQEALKYARPKSVMMNVMLFPIKMNVVWLAYVEGCIISKVKSKNTRLFAKLKGNR